MSKRYVGAEALTMVRPEGSAAPSIYVFEGDAVPAGADPDDVARLVDEGYLVEQEVADVAEDEDKPTTVTDIVAVVGSDKALAQQYLDEENAATKPRPTLVEQLEAVIAADES
jgi:hypothetical protein